MKRANLTDEVRKWAKQDGLEPVRRHLVKQGISRSTAEKLTLGSYPSEPGFFVSNAIRKAIDTWVDDKAS